MEALLGGRLCGAGRERLGRQLVAAAGAAS